MPNADANIIQSAERLDKLRRLNLLDSPAEEAFDRLTRLASKVLRAPVSLVSLVDADRQFFKSFLGLPEPWASQRETTLSHSFCQHVVATNQPLIISDSRQNPLVLDSLAIPDLNVIAYVGIPITLADGTALGSFCVIDDHARVWTDEEVEIIRELAVSVIVEIELRGELIHRQEMEKTLRESEFRYRQMVEAISDTVFTTDDEGRFSYLSPTAHRLTGYSESELIGQPLISIVEPSHRGRVASFYQAQVQERQEETILLFPIQTATKHIRWVEQKASLKLDENGDYVGFHNIVRDVTERRNAERQIGAQNEQLVRANRELAVARKQAEAANKLKSQFLATMSHELRTPLNAVIGYSQLQIAGMVGEMTEEQHGFQERILINAQHLLSLINEVLDLSKIEAGRMDLSQKPFALRVALDEVFHQSQILAEAKSLQFEIAVDDRLPEILVGDEGRIKQIIINLLSNAVKFTDMGVIKLDAMLYGKDNWRISVSDTGVGIPSHLQETIFDEFHQADQGIQRGGTGLGLAIVRKLVMMMGGNVRLNSEIGKGSTFIVTLPIVTRLPIDGEIGAEMDAETPYIESMGD